MSEFVLTAPDGANKKSTRVGRGQVPLYRRIAMRGFSNYPFKKEYTIFNLIDLEAKFADGEAVNGETLADKGMIKNSKVPVKVLGNGEITKKLTVSVEKISASAKAKIEKAGGKVVDCDKLSEK